MGDIGVRSASADGAASPEECVATRSECGRTEASSARAGARIDRHDIGGGIESTSQAAVNSTPDQSPDYTGTSGAFSFNKTVLRYVRGKKRNLGLRCCEAFVLQVYDWGTKEGKGRGRKATTRGGGSCFVLPSFVKVRVNWYEPTAELSGERQTDQKFSMCSRVSDGAFHRASPRATQQAFLEAHENANVERVIRTIKQERIWPSAYDAFGGAHQAI